MHRGYIKLFRCLQDNEMWCDEPFSRGQAWVDLLMIANHKDTHIRKRGIKISVSMGQVAWSERQLADRWKWSRGKVKRFLNELEDERQIEQQNGPQNLNVTSLITIVNYERYQSGEPQNGPQTVPQTDHKRTTNSTMEKNVKNEKNKNLSASGDAAQENDPDFLLTRRKRKLSGKRLETFNLFWEAFDYKKGRAEAADAWLDIPALTDKEVAKIIRSARSESISRPALIAEGRTPKMAQGWITGRRWEDEHVSQPGPKSETQPDLMAVSAQDSEAIRRTLEAYSAA